MGTQAGISLNAWPRTVSAGHRRTVPELERVVLEPRAGVVPAAKPPVRIFLGTETAQRRPERVFVWSIEQVRDPSRCYEIYLMKDLPGFDRRKWLTGFTNYRFAIPELAGRQGRAIYNDVDQIYLADPARLFDAPMDGHGFLSISDRDTSVMLIDCARMAGLWNLEQARRLRRKRLEARARAVAGLWGACDPGWNSRDQEYTAEGSRLVHFTIIHSQPWRPVPERYLYERNPMAYLWDDLERSADAAGFELFTASRPSSQFQTLGARYRQALPNGQLVSGTQAESRPAPSGEVLAVLDELLRDAAARSLLHCGLTAAVAPDPAWRSRAEAIPGLERSALDPLRSPGAVVPGGDVDGVLCSALLEYLPDADLPWLLDALLARAGRFLYAVVDTAAGSLPLPGGTALPAHARSPYWWRTLFEEVGRRHPRVYWRLALSMGRGWEFRCGGRALAVPPRVWVLADDKVGHRVQSEGLAQALGWPFEVKTLAFNSLARLSNHLLGSGLAAVDRHGSDPLAAPWPDLAIATGRRTAPVARWIKAQSLGKTRLVQIGRKGGDAVDAFDLLVSCRHFRLPYHPNRAETLAPVNPLREEVLAQAAERWRGLFDAAPAPHVALVVGGSSATHRLDAAAARDMGQRVAAFAAAAGGRAFAITSPRTPAAAITALRQGLGEAESLQEWRSGAPNPYLGYLALADALVVTGDSETMLGEAAATGKPLFIYPIAERRPGFRSLLAEWVVARARQPRFNKRGTVRPQRGVQRFCARLLERGLVRPRRRLSMLHEDLVQRGLAHYFGEPLTSAGHAPLHESEQVAHRVRALMGLDA